MKSAVNSFVFLLVCALALWTRLYKIEEPPHVAWDETHFGKHANFYLNRTFFFDVHPPLAKMLIAMAGYMTGYNGTFQFDKPGDKYEDHKYVGMRTFCALIGCLVVPSAYLTVFLLSGSVTASFVASLVIIFDTGTLTLSQYILLDSPLMCFIMLSTCSLAAFRVFHQDKHSHFSLVWWLSMATTGFFLACAISVKFVGLFVIVLAGINTIADLWDLLGDLKLTKLHLAQHFAARALCLILLPAATYLAFFAVHFRILNRSGNGDAFFSSAFQSQLIGNELYNCSVPEYVAYGSIVTMKNHRAGGGLLHSHPHLYPEGVGIMQQQITAYSHKDENNKFLIKPAQQNFSLELNASSPIHYVKSGDIIVLEHIMTRRNLHSHVVQAPLTTRHFQVTGYGENGSGDANDFWMIEVTGGSKGDRIKTVSSVVRLTHVSIGCSLHSHDKQLPKWGWEQMEVTCNPSSRDPNNLWNIEGNINEKLPNGDIDFYRPSFLESVVEAHKIMTQVNNNLKPKEGEITSRPWEWPVNYRGQRFSGVGADTFRVYLLGNPVLFWGNIVWLFVFMFLYVIRAIFLQRGKQESNDVKAYRDKMSYAAVWLFAGWALHYLPFYLMGRVLYFHHYFPAFLYSSMLTGVVVEFVLQSASQLLSSGDWQREVVLYSSGLLGLTTVILTSFYLFRGLSYGMEGPLSDNENSTMYGLKWLDSWEF
ncbi:protein O-mannosyl-transferase 2-like [Corticium candelabrum]|uniref:protein O-mannosyl-transferase 2-like n=1 Tax=Corticium candelabrum TaxID=121492 RepID=UPI002E26DF00|nr:protein O-mannosyl-transferase 2-like [Corticium candelabrum]